MPAIVTFDPINLVIQEIDGYGDNELLWQEIYSEWKDWLLADIARLGYPQAFRYVGADPISPTQNLGTTFFLMNGWKIRPSERDHKLTLVGNCFIEGGVGSVVVPTVGTYTVLIEMRVSNLTDSVLLNSPDIQRAAFNDGVWIDQNNTTGLAMDGTDYPAGTGRQPCLYLDDAIVIAASIGERTIKVLGDLLIDSGGDYNGLTFSGEGPARTHVTVTSASNVTNCEIRECTVTGVLDGGSSLLDCYLEDLEYIDGKIQKCLLMPYAVIKLSGVDVARMLDCWCGGTTLVDLPYIDFNGTGSEFVARNFSGCLGLKNKTGTEPISIDLLTGFIVLDSTINAPAADCIIRGNGSVIDNSTAINLQNYTLDRQAIATEVWTSNLSNWTTVGTTGRSQLLGLYNSDHGYVIRYCATHGVPGTVLGVNGTIKNPSNNWADTYALCTSLGIKSVLIDSGLINVTDDIADFNFYASNPTLSIVNLNGQICDNTSFYRCTLVGTIAASSLETLLTATECIISTCSNLTGFLVECGIAGNITVGYSSSTNIGNLYLIGCKTASGSPEIIMNNKIQTVAGTGYSGILIIDGCNNINSQARLTFTNGSLTLNNTCINGTGILSGHILLTDNSGPGFTVDASRLNSTLNTNAIWNEPIAGHVTPGTTGYLLNIAQSLPTDQAEQLLEIWKLMGLDPATSLIVTPTTRTVGTDIDQTIATVGSQVTVTRTP